VSATFWVQLMFVLFGLMALGSGLLVVTTNNLVHSALWLVVTLGALAGCFLLLAAEFVAWVQVLIYLGAVVVLLLFALMLTRAPTGRQPDLTGSNRWVAAAVGTLTAVTLVGSVVSGFRDARIDLNGPLVGSVGVTGDLIFRRWVLPFEALSVLLLAALVGAIALSRATHGPADQTPDRHDEAT
jgi:NADH-quinone oxidoreductase subunit J